MHAKTISLRNVCEHAQQVYSPPLGEYPALAYTKPVNSVFRALWLVPYLGISRIFLARMTAHGSNDMASQFPESLSEAQIWEKK